MDAVLLSSIKKELNKKVEELKSSMGFTYKIIENSIPITLNPSEKKLLDVDIPNNGFLFTTLYFWSDYSYDTYNVKFNESTSENSFCFYDTGEISKYSDSIFLLYVDKDNTKKLHMVLENLNVNRPVNIRYKLLGLEVSSNE